MLIDPAIDHQPALDRLERITASLKSPSSHNIWVYHAKMRLKTTMGPYVIHVVEYKNDKVILIQDPTKRHTKLYGKYVGIISMVPWFLQVDGLDINKCYIPHAYMFEGYRGKGIVKAIYNWVAESNCLLTTRNHSAEASLLWKSLIRDRPKLVLRSSSSKNSSYMQLAKIAPGKVWSNPNYRFLIGRQVSDLVNGVDQIKENQ